MRSSDKLCFPTLNGGKGVCEAQRLMTVIVVFVQNREVSVLEIHPRDKQQEQKSTEANKKECNPPYGKRWRLVHLPIMLGARKM